MKKTTLEDIEKEENKFLNMEIEDRFVKSGTDTGGYETMDINIIYCPIYKDFINSSYEIARITWEQTGIIYENKTFEEKEKIVLNLIKERRISAILELGKFAIKLTGIPRTMTHQIVRHRGMSFSQQSLRVSSCYSDIVREPHNMDSEMKKRFSEQVCNAKNLYKEMIKSGIPMEQARNVIPLGICTKIIMVADIKELVSYFKARTLDIAQDEHTVIANKILSEIKKTEFSKIFDVLGVNIK